MLKKIAVTSIILTILLSFAFIIIKKSSETKKIQSKEITEPSNPYDSNLLENVEYVSKDGKGNEYVIRALKGEIDFNNNEIIFLKNVESQIKLKNSNIIRITSDFGKYNTNNFDTIFSKNVVITYLDNKITGEYLDFSLSQNRMIISRNVIYTNLENILKSDVIELNIDTKDTKIFMYEKNEKVNVKSKNYLNGNN